MWDCKVGHECEISSSLAQSTQWPGNERCISARWKLHMERAREDSDSNAWMNTMHWKSPYQHTIQCNELTMHRQCWYVNDKDIIGAHIGEGRSVTYAALSLLIIPVIRAPITPAMRAAPRSAYIIVPVTIGAGTLMVVVCIYSECLKYRCCWRWFCFIVSPFPTIPGSWPPNRHS